MENVPATQNNDLPDLATVASTSYSISKNSRSTYMYAMNSFSNYCTKKNKTQNMDTLVQWLESCQSPSTKMVYVAAIRKVLMKVYHNDPRLMNIMQSISAIKLPKIDMTVTDSKYLKKKEVEKLIKKAKPDLALMIEFLFLTGVRVSELVNTELVNCKLIKAKKVCEFRVIGKGNKQNISYIPKDLYDRIVNVYKGKTYLFEHNGRRYSRENVTRRIASAGVLIGKDISAHTLRHSAACNLRDNLKLPIDKIQKFMHHSSMNTTAGFYLHDAPTPEELFG